MVHHHAIRKLRPLQAFSRPDRQASQFSLLSTAASCLSAVTEQTAGKSRSAETILKRLLQIGKLMV
jgi:hypothetical protein